MQEIRKSWILTNTKVLLLKHYNSEHETTECIFLSDLIFSTQNLIVSRSICNVPAATSKHVESSRTIIMHRTLSRKMDVLFVIIIVVQQMELFASQTAQQ
jgi:hypothetical protein